MRAHRLRGSPACRDLRQTDDIEMSLLVRAARPLPIKMLAGEYERILKRRSG